MRGLRELVEERILPQVEKPIRYQGNELNSVHKEWDSCRIKMAFAFPDTYEVGMSHLGLQILYGVVNKEEDLLMERVFAPWVDMEAKLKEYNLPLFSLESYRPLRDFNFVGFTLQYEMSFTNILNMLALGDIPLLAKERNNSHPLVFGGGPCAYNPEPLVDFFDFFMLGDGEEALPEILNLAKNYIQAGILNKDEFLKAAAQIRGIYVPKFYDVVYQEDGIIAKIEADAGVPEKVTKSIVKDLETAYFPTKPIVPYADVVHNRIMLEVLRGCTHGCRFCHAGLVYRPVRERSPETIYNLAEKILAETGHEEMSLTSLSTADYTCIEDVMASLIEKYKESGVGVSLPSLRVDAFSVNLAKEIQKVRKSTLTFAPEAGTQRLRDVINKGVTEENLVEVVTAAFSSGWNSLKLYFMIGLPTETMEDVAGIARLAHKVLEIGKTELAKRNSKQRIKITVSVSNFVPKAHTPFQWYPQNSLETLREKQQYLASLIKDRRIVYNYHDARLSYLEAVLAKSDRRVGKALLKAWEKGCKFDSWQEYFDYNKWMAAFQEAELDPDFYAYREIGTKEVLPWDHLNTGISKGFLLGELQEAYREALTGDCRKTDCSGCGICPNLDVAMVLRKGE